MAKCIYNECQYVEKFSTMPAWVRTFYIALSFLLTSLNYESNLNFATIIIIFLPLTYEYYGLSRNGRSGFRRKFHKAEFIGTVIILITGFMGLFDILSVDISENINLLYLNKEFPMIGGIGVPLITTWYIVASFSIISAFIDWKLFSTTNGNKISAFADSIS